MPVNLSIRNAPDDVVVRIKARAARNHRSLQGELMAIVEAAANEPLREKIDARELLVRVRALGIKSPDESDKTIREARDTRYGRRRR